MGYMNIPKLIKRMVARAPWNDFKFKMFKRHLYYMRYCTKSITLKRDEYYRLQQYLAAQDPNLVGFDMFFYSNKLTMYGIEILCGD